MSHQPPPFGALEKKKKALRRPAEPAKECNRQLRQLFPAPARTAFAQLKATHSNHV